MQVNNKVTLVIPSMEQTKSSPNRSDRERQLTSTDTKQLISSQGQGQGTAFFLIGAFYNSET